MNKVSPNKEIIRRICTLFHIRQCWMLNQVHTNTDLVKLLVDIKPEQQAAFQQELYDWSGIRFAVYTLHADSNLIETVQKKGCLLLPLAKNRGLNDIHKRIKVK